MSEKLYDHQQEAVDRFKNSNEIAIFFEQGCGKSATSLKIAEYKYNTSQINAALIIAPNDVHKQWAVEQVPEWLDCDYDVVCFGGRGGAKTFYPPSEGKLGIVCINIDTFSQPSKWKCVAEWARAHKTMIILDEATSIKNVNSNRTQNILTCFNSVTRRGKTVQSSVKLPECACRCVLTGTPVTNGPMDLWAIMEFVKPNFFGHNWWSFKSYYGMYTKLSVANTNGVFRDVQVLLNENTWTAIKRCTDYNMAFNLFGCSQDTYFTIHSQPKYTGPYKHAEELKDKLDKVAVFRKITECLDMPDKNYIVRNLEMNDAQKKAYKEMVNEQMTEYQGHLATALNKLTMATRLQQISSGFIYDKSYVYTGEGNDMSEDDILEDIDKDLMPDEVVWLGESNPKLDALLRDVDESDKPLIILTRYTAEAAKIYDILKDTYPSMLYTGWKKTGTIENFKEGKYDIMIANTACVARGFNLQNSHTILYYSNTFSMELREQSEARIFRSGQKNICKYVDYCFRDTVDEQVMDALKQKKSMLEYFRAQQQSN